MDPADRVRAELDLFVNGAPGGAALVVVDGGDVLVPPADLQRAGLSVREGTRVTVGGRELLSLRSLAPAIAFEVDEPSLALRITAPPELLGRHLLDLRPTLRPPETEQRLDASAFLDYAAESDLAGRLGLAFEAGGRIDRWLATTGVSRTSDGQWVRGLTAGVRDDVPALERWTVGDASAASGALGGSVLLGGISFGREFSLDPYLVPAPLPASTAVVTSPSTLEVYVNGAMVRQQPLAPGTWDLANLPAAAGQTLVHTVVRDAFGRERTLDSRFYFSSGLLAPGLTDFALAAGFLREGFGRDSFAYGAPAALGRYRFGWSESITPGVRAEASTDLFSAGASAAAGSRWGEVDGSVAASAARGDAGAAAQVAWLWLGSGTSVGLRATAQTGRYAHLSLDPRSDRPVLDAGVVAGATVSRRVGLGAELRAGRFRDLGAFASAGLRGSVQLGAGASLTLTADHGRTSAGPTGTQLLALLTWGRAGVGADATVTRDREGRAASAVSATRALPRGTGWGARVRAAEDDAATSLDATLQGQASFGRADLQVVQTRGSATWRAQAAGGVVLVDRRLYLSRPTDGAFALVDVAGLGGVGVTLENAPVGRTGADGRLLVTDLQPWYASRLGIRDRDVPLEYEPARTVRWIAPPLRGGAVVSFEVRRISALTGRLAVRLQGRDERPAFGEVSTIVDGELRTSPVTEEGRFFLERMPAGRHVLTAVWEGGSCRAAVTLPADAAPVHDAGEVRCIPDTLEPSGKALRPGDAGTAERPAPGTPDTGAGGG
jgi:outer membrane usher protein